MISTNGKQQELWLKKIDLHIADTSHYCDKSPLSRNWYIEFNPKEESDFKFYFYYYETFTHGKLIPEKIAFRVPIICCPFCGVNLIQNRKDKLSEVTPNSSQP